MFDPVLRLDLKMVEAKEVMMGYGMKAVCKHFAKPCCALSDRASSTVCLVWYLTSVLYQKYNVLRGIQISVV